MTSSTDGLEIVKAKPEDVADIEAIVKVAYSRYIERIGLPPAPMLADYAALLESEEMYVLKSGENGNVVGSIILAIEDEEKSIRINNNVVDPRVQGRGYGHVLMDHAERIAQEKALNAITLYTNVKMHENIRLYGKLGFVETGRRSEGPYERVYFRKELG